MSYVLSFTRSFTKSLRIIAVQPRKDEFAHSRYMPTATISIIIYGLEQTFYQTNTVPNLDMIQEKKQIMANLINIPQLIA